MHERYLVILKFMEYNLVVLARDDYLNLQHLAQSSPPFHKSHREEGIGGQPTVTTD